MGHAIDALSHGVKNVQKNPKLVAFSYLLMVVTLVVAIPLGVVAAILSFIPILGQLLARPLLFIPLKTLLLGGLVGLAGASFAGSMGLDDLTDTYKENGLALAGAFAIQELVVILVSVLILAVMFVVVLGGTFSMSAVGSSVGSEAAAAGFGIAIIGLYVGVIGILLAIGVFFQFLDVAVVLGDHGPTEAVKECWRLIRNGPLSVLGYTILRGLLGAVILLPGYVIAFAGGHLSDILMWVGWLIVLLLYPVAMAAVMSYHAAYYGVRIKAR